MDFVFSLESVSPKPPTFYRDYVFRVTDGDTPFKPGSWSKNNPLKNPGPKDLLYFSPALYSWIKHYFDHGDDRVYAIKRPKVFDKNMMCCGANSHYHYCFINRPELLPKLIKAIRTHNYADKDLQKMFAEHEQRVQQRFGKKLSEMKGGTYMGTLNEFDTKHQPNAYPELILPIGTFAGCEWEELSYVSGDTFVGQKSNKLFNIEQKLEKYGLRWIDPKNAPQKPA